MSEMKERVASAIRDELRKIGYGVGTINAGQLADVLAPVAIEAMRELTNPVHKAMCDAYNSPAAMWDAAITEALK